MGVAALSTEAEKRSPSGSLRRRAALVAARAVVVGALLGVLLWRAHPTAVWRVWSDADTSFLLAALALQLGGVVLSAWKWALVVGPRQRRPPYVWLLGSYLTGQFANNFLPTTVGGDALRSLQLSRRIGSLGRATVSVLVERLLGFLVLLAIADTALVLSGLGVGGPEFAPPSWILALMATVTAVAAAGLYVHFADRGMPGRSLGRLARSVESQLPRGSRLAAALALSLAFQCVWIATNAICGSALGLDVPILVYAVITTVADVVSLAPVFLNGLGARELVFVLYLSSVHVSTPAALALAFTVFTVRLAASAIGGAIIVFGGAEFRLRRRSARSFDAR
jgi:glycosyltransferase 2 family protein